MSSLEKIFAKNQEWSEKLLKQDPDFFEKLNEKQQPEYLWIGCCDSRVPAEIITGLSPGTMLVHRNIANQVLPADNSVNAILQFALKILKIRNIIITGHTNCGGVNAVINGNAEGNMATWLNSLKKTYHKHKEYLETEKSTEKKANLLSEFNVKQQVSNVKQCDIVQKIEIPGEYISVYGLMYDMKSGRLKQLKI